MKLIQLLNYCDMNLIGKSHSVGKNVANHIDRVKKRKVYLRFHRLLKFH